MVDSFTKTTSTSWFSRMGSSFKGIIFGFVMVIISFPLLFWNEGEAVKNKKALDEGSKEVITIENNAVAADNEGRLVHVTGEAKTEDILSDDQFGIELNAIKLSRTVEMYQWVEETETKTKQKIGGGEETITTYNYEKEWSDDLIDSDDFEESTGHSNPARMEYESAELIADNVTLGAFKLSDQLVRQISNYADYNVSEENLPEASVVDDDYLYADDYYYYDLPDPSADQKVKVTGGSFYVGNDPDAPQIGDLRISYRQVKPGDVSIIAMQYGDSFKPYKTSNGKTIEMLDTGVYTADEMFTQAQASNQVRTWVFRAIGFFLMFAGLSAILKPLSTIGAVIPLLGNIIGWATGLISFLIALVLSLVTIAIAWLFYRPLIGLALLAVAAAGVYGIMQLKKKNSSPASAQATATAPSPPPKPES